MDQQPTEQQAREMHRTMLLGQQTEHISVMEHQVEALSQELRAVIETNDRLQSELNLWHRAFERPCPDCHAGLGPDEIGAEPHAKDCGRAVKPEELDLAHFSYDHPFARVAMTEQQRLAVEAAQAELKGQ